MFRVGLLAVLRSKALKGKTIGVMITASHNPEEVLQSDRISANTVAIWQDNGVKLVEPLGEMMISEWEEYATQLANASNDNLVPQFSRLFARLKLDVNDKARVIFARDTR